MAVRESAVAGMFYPGDGSTLRKYCQARLGPRSPLISAKAVVLPHAGYTYSGETACRVLSQVDVPKVNFLIGPNHHGRGAPFAMMSNGEWETPLGCVRIQSDLALGLLNACSRLMDDPLAHQDEHSLEVEVPFLQTRNPHMELVPMVVGTHDLTDAGDVARSCGKYLATFPERVLLVISSDMNHFESDKATRVKDAYALRAIEALDAEALAKAIRTHRITMCGFVPVYMLLSMKEALGIRKATLVDYRTSADATGDQDRVVGYAGFIFE